MIATCFKLNEYVSCLIPNSTSFLGTSLNTKKIIPGRLLLNTPTLNE